MISPAVLLSMATAHIQSSPRISQPESIVANAINNNVTNAIVNNSITNAINSNVVANALNNNMTSLVQSDPPDAQSIATGSLMLNEPVPSSNTHSYTDRQKTMTKTEVPQLDIPIYRHSVSD